MPVQRQTTAQIAVFTLPPDSLTLFDNLHTVADCYPLVADSDESRTYPSSIYVDTADYRLLRTGFTVRLDQDGSQLQLTVENVATSLPGKLDKAIRRRVTVTEPIATPAVTGKLKAWPTALRKAVARVISGHIKLYPLLLLQCSRTIYTIAAPPSNGTPSTSSAVPLDASRPLAAMNLDRVTVWAPTEDLRDLNAFVPDRVVATFGHLRLTFDADAATEQAAITAWLTDQRGLQPTHYSLFVQALLAAMRHTPGAPGAAIDLQPQMPVVDACRLIWREQLIQILLTEAGVRYSQEREYVHDMRVAIRRARAAAKFYGHFFARKTIRPYLSTLRKTGRLLGNVRNLDVTIAKARRGAKDKQGKRAPKKLLQAWQQQRQVAHEALIKWLDSVEYSDFLIDFHRFSTTPEHPSKRHAPDRRVAPTPQQVRHVLPSLIMECYAAVRCYEALFETALPIDYTTLHDLRIACKHLRYNLEFTEHLLGPEIKMLIKRLKELQELLGDLNDAVVAQTLLDETEKDGAASAYQQAQARLVDELRTQISAALAALVDQDSRQQLGQALAYL